MNYLQKRARAFRAAGAGILSLFRSEAHAKIHLAATVCVIAAAAIFRCSSVEWCVIIICIGAVIAAEAVNTAIERLADRVTTDHDPLIGAAKDLAAAAVLILSLTSLFIAAIIFIPRLTQL